MKLIALAVAILSSVATGKLTVLTAGQLQLESVCSSVIVAGIEARREETNALRSSVPRHRGDCDTLLRACTKEELQQKMAAHGKDAHRMDIASLPEEQKQALMSIIRQEWAHPYEHAANDFFS